jgi:hypothetical protein
MRNRVNIFETWENVVLVLKETLERSKQSYGGGGGIDGGFKPVAFRTMHPPHYFVQIERFHQVKGPGVFLKGTGEREEACLHFPARRLRDKEQVNVTVMV